MQLDDYINKASHCENPMVVRNRFTGEDILVGCGHCAYCVSRQSSINSIRIAKSATKWKYCYFVTLTYDNEHMPLISLTTQEMISGEIVYSDDGLRYSSDTEFKYMPLRAAVAQRPAFSSEYQTIFCKQVNGTIPFNRETKRKEPIEFTSTAVPADLLRLVSKTTPETPFNVPDDMAVLPILNYYDCQNYVKRLRINLNRLGCNEKIHFYAAGEYGPVHFRPHFHLLLFGNTQEFSETVRQAHVKSWTFGRSDIQLATGGASSYVASYISANSMLPVFYRQSKLCDPKAALRCVSIWKHRNLLRLQTKRLRGLPLISVMDEALLSTLNILALMPPVRISIPYVPNSMDFEELMLMKYLSLFALWQQRLKDLDSSPKKENPKR